MLMMEEYIEATLKRAHKERLESGTFFVAVPELPGVWAEGATEKEALATLKEVIEGWVLLGIKMGHEIPVLDRIDFDAIGQWVRA